MSGARLGLAWRFAALAGATAGLAVSPFVPRPPAGGALIAAAAVAVALLTLVRPRGSPAALVAGAWLAALALATASAGLAVGSARLAAIDAGALDLAPGREVVVRGFVVAVPARSAGEVSVRVETPRGRLEVRAPEPVEDLAVGAAVRAPGTVREPGEWERARLERLGVRDVLAAGTIEAVAGRRGGLDGLLDGVRSRAEAALGEGTSPEAANLLRGFVLGQDDRIADATVDEFKASGLAHLLAVSGQNVVLLAVLAAVVLAVLGVPRRPRLAWILVLIAIYVPVAGAGASIQRAGVMGAAGVIAALAGRPRSRWYALLLAACATLGLDPRASADVGWQLSFVAVVGILLASSPLADALARGASGWRRALADGVALTIAATVATAPLMAHHFGTVSVVALPANLLALPAVAPVMWLGMLAAAAGQFAWLPVEPLTWLAGLLAGFIAQVAGWFASPAFAQIDVALDDPGLALAYGLLGAAAALGLRWTARRRELRRSGPAPALSARRRQAAAVIAGVAVLAVVALAIPRPDATAEPPDLRLTVLDVGQGDSILLEPADGDPVLVDAGPAAAEVAEQLDRHGIERLAALVITHPQDDHDGGAADLLARVPTERLVFARARPATIALARAAGARAVRVAAGARLRSGSLRVDVLWPPPERLAAQRGEAPEDPNSLSLVLRARWRGFAALLAGDAEAEAAPLEPGPIDLLKVAHHGSADAGLASLVELADPRLAVISVGGDNPFGHPSPATLASLAEHGVPVLRTDLEGEVAIEVTGSAWAIR